MTLYVTDTLDVEALVENTGTVAGQQDIVLEADGSEVSRRSDLVVRPQDTESVILEWSTGGATAGQQGLVVRSDDTSVSQTVNLQAAGSISIDSVVPSNPDPGEQTTVATTLENVSDERRVYFLDLVVDGTVEDELPVILGGGQSASGPTLSWTPQTAGDKSVEVRAAVASDSTTVTVGDAATIPASVIHQYRAEDFASPWPDNVGGADMSISGLTQSTFPNGETSVFGDGTDDFGDASGPETLPSNETFGIAYTFETTAANEDQLLLSARDGNNDFFVRTSDGIPSAGTAFPVGCVELTLIDGNDKRIRTATDATYDDGDEHLVVINKTGNAAADVDFYVDDMSTPVAQLIADDSGFDHSAYSQGTNLRFYGFSGGGFEFEADVGFFEFNSDTYSQSERDGLKTRRPEV